VLAGSASEWCGGQQRGGQQRRRGREEKTTQKEIQASRQICKYDLYERNIRGGGEKRSSRLLNSVQKPASCRKGDGRNIASPCYFILFPS